MEYDSYYGSGLLGYLYGSVIKKDPVAAALEEKAALLLQKNSRAIHIYDYHRNNWAKAALAYLTHRHGGGRAEPLPFEKAWQALEGTFHHPWWQNLWHRDRRKLASFSWGTISSKGDHFGGAGSGVCGYVIPARLADGAPEPLVYLHPHSITGVYEVTDGSGQRTPGPLPSDIYHFTRYDTQFHTAGRTASGPIEQRMAFFSFAQGPCVFMNVFKANGPAKLDWSGVPVYFYTRPGMTSSRRYFDAAGERRLEQPYQGRTSWWCVNDLLGAAFVGGTGGVKVERTVGRNWARTDAYKDKCDTVFFSGVKAKELQPGESYGELAAVFYPETGCAEVEEASRELQQAGLSLPSGWKGLIVPGKAERKGIRYLAVANLGGQCSRASLNLYFEEGAPVLSVPSFAQGKKATIPLSLNPFETLGETIAVYTEVQGNAPVEIRRLSLGRYSIKPATGEKVKIRLRFLVEAGPLQMVGTDEKLIVEIPAGSQEKDGGFLFDIDREVIMVNKKGVVADTTGPAVEISEVNVREDGRVSLRVDTGDQSGVQSVEVFMDGKPAAKIAAEPWTWTGRPGNGYHTFYVIARDGSLLGNTRTSDARTIKVDAPGQLN
jgi:hypothetical protein